MKKFVAEHTSFFYQNADELAENVACHVAEAFEALVPVILVMTGEHRAAVDSALVKADLDPEFLKTVDVIRYIDAEECLEQFTVAGALDEKRFQAVIGAALGKTPVHAYGEMVDTLSQRGRFDDALELERMWNRLSKSREFNLLCGYCTKSIGSKTPDHFLTSVCQAHSHVQPPRNAPREAAMIRDSDYAVSGY